MAERKVIIGRDTFLYREKGPWVRSGKSIAGALELDQEEDRVRCHECGEWFEALYVHIKSHQITAREYKIRHRLRAHSALINERIRKLHSDRAAQAFIDHPERLASRKGKGRFAAPRRPAVSLELRNKRHICPEQLLADVRKLGNWLGKTPSQSEALNADVITAGAVQSICAGSAALALNVSGWNEVVRMAGFVANPKRAGNPFGADYLIERLRDFYVRFGRLPRTTDVFRGLLPAIRAFYREFGSWANALRAAGLPGAGEVRS
jgi:hypothetical protein